MPQRSRKFSVYVISPLLAHSSYFDIPKSDDLKQQKNNIRARLIPVRLCMWIQLTDDDDEGQNLFIIHAISVYFTVTYTNSHIHTHTQSQSWNFATNCELKQWSKFYANEWAVGRTHTHARTFTCANYTPLKKADSVWGSRLGEWCQVRKQVLFLPSGTDLSPPSSPIACLAFRGG